MDKHYQVDFIMLDLFKAIGIVVHNKLLLKSKHYGTQSNTHSWLQTWFILIEPRRLVSMELDDEGETSNCETLKLLSGVLLGTFLKSLMFSLYIYIIMT